MAPTVARLAEHASGFIGSVAKAREALWASQDPNARVRYGVERADEHFDRILGKASALQQAARELAPATKAGFFSRLLTAKAGLAEIREHAQGAGSELQEILRLAEGHGIRTALGEVRQMQRGALLGAGELRLGGGRAAMLADAADPAFASAAPYEGLAPGVDARAAAATAAADVVPASPGEAAAPVSALVPDFTQEDLSAIGSALDPGKPPAQTFWSDTMVNLVSSEGRKQGGLSEEQAARDAETARLALEGRGDARGAGLELTAADLAAVLKKAGVDLTRVDPNQVVAAVRYLNGTSSLAAQQEELRKVIDSFHVLGRIGLPKLPREHLLGQLDNFGHLPRKATEKLSDAELQAKFQEIAGTFNAGGELQTKIGKYNLKLSVDAQGQVTKSECKKPGFFSRLWNGVKKLAPIALTVASFIPVTAPFARAVQAGISLVKAIRSKSLLGIATAGANLVGAGVTAIAGKAASAAGTVANRVATMATSTARALQGVSAIRQGNVLGGLANIGGAVASGIGGLASKAADKLNKFGKTLGDVSDGMLKAATGMSALQAYQRAGRAVDEAKKALAAAQVSGDSRQVDAARRQLEEAERAKQGALFGGLGSTVMVAADMVGNKKTPAPGQPLDQQPAFGLDAALRAASRGLNLTGNVATKDWESAGANALGMAAAVQAGLRPKPSEPQTEAEGRAAQARKRMEEILGAAARISTLSDASNLADAALAYRQSDKAEDAANTGVANAERALAAARQTGDPEAIRQAEANLSQARRAAEGALMGSIAAGDALMTTPQMITGRRRAAHAFEGAVDAYGDFLATRSRAAALANRSGPFTEAGEAAAGEWSRLNAAKEKYEHDLAEAHGDPDKINAVVARFRDEQAEVGTRLAAIETRAQAPVYGDGLGAPPSEARIIPASAQQGTTAPRDIRAEARKHVEIDRRILSEADAEILRRARRDREGFAYPDPRLVRAADDMRKALSELEALGDDAPRDAFLAASLRLNVARNTLGQTLNPTPGAPDPLVVGISTFVEEFGSRAFDVLSLGGTAGIKAALADGRLDSQSGFLDFTKAYWEGVLNGVTFGGADEYWQSRADRKSVIDSLSMGLLRFGEGVFAVDEYKVLTDPKSNKYEKAAAFSSMVAKYAGLGAGGKALQERFTTRTPSGSAPGTIPPEHGVLDPETGRLRDPETGRFVSDPAHPPSPYAFTDAQRRAAWKRLAEDPNSPLTDLQRQEIRQRGWRGPQRINPTTGELETMELSHEPTPLRGGGTEVVPRWPDEHAAVDPHRRLKKGT